MFPHQFPNNKDTPLAGHASTAGLQSSPFAASSQAVCTNPLCSQVLLSQESAVSAPPPRGSWEEVTCRASQRPNEHDLEATAQGVVSPRRGPALGPRASPPWLLFRDSWSPSRFCSCGLEPRYRPLVPHLQEPLKPSFSPAE